MFMGGAGANTTAAAAGKRGLLDGLLGGGAAGGAGAAGAAGGAGAGADASGTKTQSGASEQGVSKAAGTGATSGLPTVADDGTVSMTFHQVGDRTNGIPQNIF